MVGKHRNRILFIHWRFILTHGFVNTLRSIRIIPIPILASSSSSSSSLYCEGLISQYDHFSKLVNLIVSMCVLFTISLDEMFIWMEKKETKKKSCFPVMVSKIIGSCINIDNGLWLHLVYSFNMDGNLVVEVHIVAYNHWQQHNHHHHRHHRNHRRNHHHVHNHRYYFV